MCLAYTLADDASSKRNARNFFTREKRIYWQETDQTVSSNAFNTAKTLHFLKKFRITCL